MDDRRGRPRPGITILLAGFVALQLYLILVVGYGPFRDEAFYVTSGLELWRGRPYPADRYLFWFNGSPYMWPALAGLLYEAGGVAAARIGALACVALSVALAYGAGRRLVGVGAALAGAVVVLLGGNTMILGHYATYDPLGFVFVAFALWAVARRIGGGAGGWTVVGGLALWLGALSKYPFAVMGLPLAALLLALGGPRRVRDAAVFGVSSAVPFVLTMVVMFHRPLPPTLVLYDHHTFAGFLVGAVTLGYVAVPLILLAAGWLGRRPEDGPRVSALLAIGLGSVLLWPLLHTASGQIASAFKHVWIGVLVASPAVGFGAYRAWRVSGRWVRGLALTGIALLGAVEWFALEPMTYPDFMPSVDFLLAEAAPGDRVQVIGDNDRWVYAMFLFGEGRIASPWSVVDPKTTGPGSSCDADWVVATRTDVTGPVDASSWPCPLELAFQDRQRFLNYRGAFDVQTFQIWRRASRR
ncbi:MAG TPA: glycosyltransferase family 39 protein [Longimicrobiales bacterium]|nr:glycosyltransferase family 39 protein [Longimicrobiales bacterium]